MTTLSTPTSPRSYLVPETALRRWTKERLRRQSRPDGSAAYLFTVSGSTCNSFPIEVVMTVVIDPRGRIKSAAAQPDRHDTGSNEMCTADHDGAAFLDDVGACDEVLGMTLEEAAFRDWREEPSGCFCTEGQRRHKWRNVFQTLHYAATHPEV